jgi:uridine kinase
LKNGEYDFESIDCIDLDLFNKQLNQILNGEEVSVPTYNFVEGKKEYKGRLIKLKENDIILIEGLHCLNEALTSTIPKDAKLKVYISPFMPLSVDRHNHISTVDIRLLRRIVRDNRTRGYNVQDTLKSWDKEEYLRELEEEREQSIDFIEQGKNNPKIQRALGDIAKEGKDKFIINSFRTNDQVEPMLHPYAIEVSMNNFEAFHTVSCIVGNVDENEDLLEESLVVTKLSELSPDSFSRPARTAQRYSKIPTTAPSLPNFLPKPAPRAPRPQTKRRPAKYRPRGFFSPSRNKPSGR